MANGWALGKFAGEFAQVTQTYTASHVRLWPLADNPIPPENVRYREKRT